MLNPAILRRRRFGGDGPMHVVVHAGQSNAVGNNTYDAINGFPANVYQYTQAGELTAPTFCMDHLDYGVNNDGAMDSMLQFSREYIAANPGVTLVIIPCGDPGSGFSNNLWNEGDTNYEATVSRINAFAAAYPNAIWKAVFWNQGETEAAASWTEAQYTTALTNMITALRTDAPAVASVPFIAQEMRAETASYPTASQIGDAIVDLPNNASNAAYTSCAGTLMSYDNSDNVHYGPVGQRRIGLRQFNVLSGVGVAGGFYNPPEVLRGGDFSDENDWITDAGWSVSGDDCTFDSGGDSSAGPILRSKFLIYCETGVTYTATIKVTAHSHSLALSNTIRSQVYTVDDVNTETYLNQINDNSTGDHVLTWSGSDAPVQFRIQARPQGGTLTFTIDEITVTTS